MEPKDPGQNVIGFRSLDDGTQVWEYENGTTVSRDAKGAVVTRYPIGDVVTRPGDGTTRYEWPDGSSAVRYADGSLVAYGSDGKMHRIVRPDGREENYDASGRLTHSIDGAGAPVVWHDPQARAAHEAQAPAPAVPDTGTSPEGAGRGCTPFAVAIAVVAAMAVGAGAIAAGVGGGKDDDARSPVTTFRRTGGDETSTTRGSGGSLPPGFATRVQGTFTHFNDEALPGTVENRIDLQALDGQMSGIFKLRLDTTLFDEDDRVCFDIELFIPEDSPVAVALDGDDVDVDQARIAGTFTAITGTCAGGGPSEQVGLSGDLSIVDGGGQLRLDSDDGETVTLDFNVAPS